MAMCGPTTVSCSSRTSFWSAPAPCLPDCFPFLPDFVQHQTQRDDAVGDEHPESTHRAAHHRSGSFLPSVSDEHQVEQDDAEEPVRMMALATDAPQTRSAAGWRTCRPGCGC
jgi:hypothetical protein